MKVVILQMTTVDADISSHHRAGWLQVLFLWFTVQRNTNHTLPSCSQDWVYSPQCWQGTAVLAEQALYYLWTYPQSVVKLREQLWKQWRQWLSRASDFHETSCFGLSLAWEIRTLHNPKAWLVKGLPLFWELSAIVLHHFWAYIKCSRHKLNRDWAKAFAKNWRLAFSSWVIPADKA